MRRSKAVAVDVERRPRKRCRVGAERTDDRVQLGSRRQLRHLVAANRRRRSRFVSRPHPRTTGNPRGRPMGIGGLQVRAGRRRHFRCAGDGRSRTANHEFWLSAAMVAGRRRSCFPARIPSARSFMSRAPMARQLRQVLAPFLDEFASYRAAWHPDGIAFPFSARTGATASRSGPSRSTAPHLFGRR